MCDKCDPVLLFSIYEFCVEDGEEKVPKKKRIWIKNWLKEKNKFSNNKLLRELKENQPDDYKNYMRMDEETFMYLLEKVDPLIKKQNTILRDAIPSETRLAITLRFLATGNSYEDLKFSSIVSPQAIGKIVVETCESIIKVLKDYIKLPRTSDEWREEALKFKEKSGFPHCLGAIDGKHIQIVKPKNSGSFYFNYKKTFSIVLMAVVNSNSEFLMVDIGVNGRVSDGGVFAETKFNKKMLQQELNIPDPEEILPGGEKLPYVLVGDDAFPLRADLLKPYKHQHLTKKEEFFNQRLSSARVKVEHAFGILAARFRILLTTINLCPEKVSTIILACCFLHNFLSKKRGAVYNHIDSPNSENLIPMESSSFRNTTTNAKDIRNKFCEVINSI